MTPEQQKNLDTIAEHLKTLFTKADAFSVIHGGQAIVGLLTDSGFNRISKINFTSDHKAVFMIKLEQNNEIITIDSSNCHSWVEKLLQYKVYLATA